MQINSQTNQHFIYPVGDKVLKQAYNSPASLHGKYKWLTQ
jgi:hypothetical protein